MRPSYRVFETELDTEKARASKNSPEAGIGTLTER